MKWLRDYVTIDRPVADLAHRLTMSGNEVEAIEEIGATWHGIVVAEVARIDPHPNADRLVLATVNLGDREQTVVTGAPNLAVGMRVPFAPVGATLIDGHTGQPMTLKPAKIRGVESAGMVCSEKELGLGDDHSGIMVLPPDAPIGARLGEYLGDTIVTIKSTANRPDTMSMLGVAWEVAAITGQTVRSPATDVVGQAPSVAEQFSVAIADPELCPRYTAALIRNVVIGPSPQWLQDRLIA
ncbi:MAG: phenylalanine--tRNA ligase subunit beta, partial [Thermomicrobium sp.]|nr:phenylalanine--tRNA ligase subunit beta [Thermomicrobium sp.]